MSRAIWCICAADNHSWWDCECLHHADEVDIATVPHRLSQCRLCFAVIEDVDAHVEWHYRQGHTLSGVR